MPQMKPMNWLLLMLYFLIMFLFTMSYIYFIYLKNYSNFKINMEKIKQKNMFNFKW
nr:ATP synthase F0 subunit 8 [Parnips nigripes]